MLIRKKFERDMGEKTPWEQHASAAGLPRFNYKALSSTHSLKGFLITCALDREKSATKEAMTIITKHFESPNLLKSDVGENAMQAFDHDGKREKESSHITDTVGQIAGDDSACNDSSTLQSLTAEKNSNKDALNLKRSRAEFENSKADHDRGIFFSKMAQKGIISIFWESSKTNDPVTILSKVLADVENASSASLRWCQRMVPVQASCVYSRESFSPLVTKLVIEHLGNSLPTEMQPLKYAVSFNRRGFEAREVDRSTNNEGLDRMSCIHLVTAAVASVAPHTVVDLKAPQMVVIVEVIPFAGAQSSPICGVAVLSGTLMNTKPRLSVKSLVVATCQKKQPGH